MVLACTVESDLPELMTLWNDGRVMSWVGFPGGLRYDMPRMLRWLHAMRAHPDRFHFTARCAEIGFCGELYCDLNRAHRRAGLDIKFTPGAQGDGRSRIALRSLIRWIFATLPEADAVWTEPVASNLASRTLYYSCGLRSTERPADLEPGPSYWELTRASWRETQSSLARERRA